MTVDVAVPCAVTNAPDWIFPYPLCPKTPPELIGVPPDRKFARPNGPSPPLLVFTVAVNVTDVPWTTLLLLEVIAVVVGALVTVMFTGAERLALKPPSPL